MDGLTKGKAQVQEAAFTNAFFFAYVCATRHYYLLDKFNEFSQVRKDVEEASILSELLNQYYEGRKEDEI